MEMCLQKDDIISKLQAAMDATADDATRDVKPVFFIGTSSRGFSKFLHVATKLFFLTESSGGVHQVGAPAGSGEVPLSEQDQQ